MNKNSKLFWAAQSLGAAWKSKFAKRVPIHTRPTIDPNALPVEEPPFIPFERSDRPQIDTRTEEPSPPLEIDVEDVRPAIASPLHNNDNDNEEDPEDHSPSNNDPETAHNNGPA
eukprot:629096-Ditylum_brightwellii.AAC.1